MNTRLVRGQSADVKRWWLLVINNFVWLAKRAAQSLSGGSRAMLKIIFSVIAMVNFINTKQVQVKYYFIEGNIMWNSATKDLTQMQLQFGWWICPYNFYFLVLIASVPFGWSIFASLVCWRCLPSNVLNWVCSLQNWSHTTFSLRS